MSLKPLPPIAQPRPNLHDPKLSGAKYAAVLRAQLLYASSASPAPCEVCEILGRLNCTHLTASQCASLSARRMRAARASGDALFGAPGDPAIQIYSCPARHAYEGPAHLGGRAISARARAWEGARERVPDMCPQCWSEAINEGYRGGRRPWDQDMVTLRKKGRRESKRWVRQLRSLLDGACESDEEAEAEGEEMAAKLEKKKKKKKTTTKRKVKKVVKNWKLSKEEEGKYGMRD